MYGPDAWHTGHGRFRQEEKNTGECRLMVQYNSRVSFSSERLNHSVPENPAYDFVRMFVGEGL